MSLPRRFAHKVGLDHNPLCRGTDQAERWIKVAIAIVILLVNPVITILISHSVYCSGINQELHERVGRYPTHAVLMQDAKLPTPEVGNTPTVLTLASWKVSDDTSRTGWVRSKVGLTAGTKIQIWINSTGMPTDTPRDHSETLAETVATAIFVPIGMIFLCGLMYYILHVILEHRRLAQWQAAWLRVEPRWSGRHA